MLLYITIWVLLYYYILLLHSTELLYFIEKLTVLPCAILTFEKKVYCQNSKKYSFSSSLTDSTLLVISINNYYYLLII